MNRVSCAMAAVCNTWMEFGKAVVPSLILAQAFGLVHGVGARRDATLLFMLYGGKCNMPSYVNL